MNHKAKQFKVKVKEIKKIKSDIFLMSFSSAYLAKVAQPGQFLHIKVESVILRRPFSIHKIEKGKTKVLFRVRGRGTKKLSQSKKGIALDMIGPLGEGFKLSRKRVAREKKQSILLAGGIGVAPLVYLAQKLPKGDNKVLLGSKTKKDIVAEAEFKKLGFKSYVSTDDGSSGKKGTVVDLLETVLKGTKLAKETTVFACGPKEMLFEIAKVLKKYPKVNCQVSFEQFMGCGLGICCACVIKTKQGYRKVCKDGPVFNIKDIV
ncbi:MAG: dihydroorotate dehydrogenase electron transfer subunit [Candidatus Omnitrophica bacterium]|nr:dihydroorotate dehydrogenase electron transfer subunit [Candidatus Omnitrophota bacterium]